MATRSKTTARKATATRTEKAVRRGGKTVSKKAPPKKTNKQTAARSATKKTTKKTPARDATTKTARKNSRTTKTATAGAAGTRTSAAKKATARTAAGGNAAAKKTAKTVAKKAPGKSATPAARQRAGASAPRAKSRRGEAAITPEQALANTRSLLQAKQAQDRQPPPWQSAGSGEAQPSHAGFQSEEAARKAEQLHEGESRIPAIHGSNSTRNRQSQGKRDNR